MRQKRFCHFCATPLERRQVEGRDRLYCTTCGRPLYENPIPATCLVVADDAERVLLVKRNVEPEIGAWCLPGGFVELGERPEEAALRELREETGLEGTVELLLGVAAQSSRQYHTVLIAGYLVRRYSGTAAAGDDASDVAFFGREEMPGIPFRSHRGFVEAYYQQHAGR
jgi:ADP-ribose pyrophosphatase YjhB (NUDIX family)